MVDIQFCIYGCSSYPWHCDFQQGPEEFYGHRIVLLIMLAKNSIISFLIWLRRNSHHLKFNRFLEKKIAKLDGGFIYSLKIRELYKELHGLSIGYGTYGGCWNNTSMWWSSISIGNYCSFASQVFLFPCNHPMQIFTTHPITYDVFCSGATKQRTFSHENNSLVIGHGVWFGHGAIVLSGCKKIGNGAVIGAGSIVTHDVPPYAIVCGNPARIIKYRLSPEQIERVENSRWWELNKEELNKEIDNLLKLTANDG